MTINDEAKLIRQAVERLRPGTGRKYSAALRRQILAWVERAKASGMLDIDCSEAIGVPQHRFAMWRDATPDAKRAGDNNALVPFGLPLEMSVEPVSKQLVPIEVTPTVQLGGGLALATPSGFRVEGLTLEQAYALLREFV